MHILLTEGAGLTSRQVATRLDQLGHDVSAAVSDPLCLARFTRHVRTLHGVPDFGQAPLVWFDHLLDVATKSHVDMIFPTQEQVTVLSHQLPRLRRAGLVTAVPPFASLVQVQDKLSALRTLGRLEVPQPRTIVVQDPSEATAWSSFPAYVKTPVGTGSAGVRRVTDATGLTEAVRHFIAAGAGADGGVLVQEALTGTFVMAQCVFDNGSLVAFHANERVQEGANGSAAAKSSIDAPGLRTDLVRLGQALDWHGALSVDAIVDRCPDLRHRRQPAPGRAGQRPGRGDRHGRRAPRRGHGHEAGHRSTLPDRRAHPPVPHGAPGHRPAHRTASECAGRDRPLPPTRRRVRRFNGGAAPLEGRPADGDPSGGRRRGHVDPAVDVARLHRGGRRPLCPHGAGMAATPEHRSPPRYGYRLSLKPRWEGSKPSRS